MLPHHVVYYAVSRVHRNFETSKRLDGLFNLIDALSDEVIIDFVTDASSGKDPICKDCAKRSSQECISDIEAEEAMLICIKNMLNMNEDELFTIRNLRYIVRNENLTDQLDGDAAMIALRLSQRRARQ